MNLVLAIALLPVVLTAQTWEPQHSGTTESLRGIHAVSDKIVWASGSGGTYLRTTDGGLHWLPSIVPGAEALDFRDVHAVDERTAYLLSIGPGGNSRIYKTNDAGAHWTLQLTNPDPTGFFDEMAFWNPMHGILVGDPVGGQLVVMTTSDGGTSWQRQRLPAAREGESVFAASGTGIAVIGNSEVWIGTGGTGGGRVFHSMDAGVTWSVADTTMRHDSQSAGIFSIAFSDPLHGIAVGGDYKKIDEAANSIALTSDGGRTWIAPATSVPTGFRSAVAFVRDRNIWIATGTSGSDISYDGGQSWTSFDKGNYNAISFVGAAGWAVGPKGRIAKFQSK